MDMQQREVAAKDVYRAALVSLNFNYDTRQQLAIALVAEARKACNDTAPVVGYDVRWIAGRGLAWSGYGGGL